MIHPAPDLPYELIDPRTDPSLAPDDGADQALSDANTDAIICHELQQTIRTRRRRCDQLRRLLDHLENQIAADEHMLAEMEGALGIADQLRLEQLDSTLRGQRIREVALELLISNIGADQTIHYRTWFALFEEAGHHIEAKNPLAAFLAQVNRTPEVEQLGRRSGLYRLKRMTTGQIDNADIDQDITHAA